MEVWVFSYNRGKFLENCISSIEKCMPSAAISVFDDNSDDQYTQKVLADVGKSHRVIQPSANRLESKHGGLYANMQTMLEQTAATPKSDFVCCLQDDTQFVRPVSKDEVNRLCSLLSEHPGLGFVRPSFLRGCNKPQDVHRIRYDASVYGYYVDRYDSSAGAFYSDIFIASTARLREKKWQFFPRESENEQQARKLFEQMVYWRDPFIAWLPNVPAFRGRRLTLALKLAQKKMKPDYCPLHIMSNAQRDQFIARANESLPYAEDYLEVTSGAVSTPWRYYPLQGKRWLKRLNQLELGVRKLLRKP